MPLSVLGVAELVRDASEHSASDHDVPDPTNRGPEVFAELEALLDEATGVVADALAQATEAQGPQR